MVVYEDKKPLTINPLKNSPPLGAVIAFLGMHKAIPLIHGCQGCAAFIKSILNRHFREPVYLHNTAITETEVIMDGRGAIVKGLNRCIEREDPEIVGIISTALTEVKGDDLCAVIHEFRTAYPLYEDTEIIPVIAPDYTKSSQDGYAEAIMAAIESLICRQEERCDKRINLLPGLFLTPSDITALKEVITFFGLTSIVLPDTSQALGGYLKDDISFIAKGGTKKGDIKIMGGSVATLSIGESMRPVAQLLKERTGVPCYHFDTIYGVEAFDRFVRTLSAISGSPIPEKLKQERRQLADVLLDTHFYISSKRFAIGLEPDLLKNITALVNEMGGEVVVAVSPFETRLINGMKVERCVIGDLDDLKTKGGDAQMVISNSNAVYAASELGIPLMRMGFPVVDRLGIPQKVNVGYRGTMNILFEIGNIFIERRNYENDTRNN